MSLIHALVLGITQGLSEFLPISSSGHLRLVPWLFGWDDFAGRPDLELAFDVALHIGTLAWLLLLSAVPAALLGALLESTVEHLGEAEWTIGLFLVVFGLVLLWADRLGGTRPVEQAGVRDAVTLGAAQALALGPGG